MKSIKTWLEEYGESHMNKTNKLIHWICVPSIMFSLLGLLWTVNLGLGVLPPEFQVWENLGVVFFIGALVFYFLHSFSLAIGMFLISGAMLLLINYLNGFGTKVLVILSASVFVIAWIGQFIGHNIEGKKPSFLEDVEFLLIGPAWLLSFIYRKLGIRY